MTGILRSSVHKVGLVLLGTGGLLLALNVVGVLLGGRAFTEPPEAAVANPLFGRATTAAETELARRIGETDAEYVKRLTHAVHGYMVHYWDEEGGARVPLLENWVLHGLGRLNPERYGAYEFQHPARGLERGFGLCSQQAMIVADLLSEAGIETEVLGLGGHVVTEARLGDERTLLLDADYGVVVPYSLKDVEAQPDRVAPLYRAEGFGDEAVARIVEIYGPDGNRPYASRSRRRASEDRTYLIKWLAPFGAVLLGLLAVEATRRMDPPPSEAG
ncbi:MAG: hypothetical protein QNK05_08640 [Myxococcota bacterium]|nr:hypothetical protein [Myxococcota bacterium]